MTRAVLKFSNHTVKQYQTIFCHLLSCHYQRKHLKTKTVLNNNENISCQNKQLPHAPLSKTKRKLQTLAIIMRIYAWGPTGSRESQLSSVI